MSTDIHNSTNQRWLTGRRAILAEQFAAQTARLTELTADTGDPGEAHNRAALLASTRQSLEQLSGALGRIAAGTYGRCERCGAGIPPERLEIVPHARFCMPCQSR